MEKENKKEISNKKAIIALIVTGILLIILGTVYATLLKPENDNCNNIINNSSNKNFKDFISAGEKPIIYIYPEQETKVSVTVGRPENLTHTYPKYEESWEVIAKPNGDLVDCKTGRNLYALYWEGIDTSKSEIKEGFIVKGSETIEFLEEKLEILGLTEREAEEFIVYWLPKLQENKYNYVRFATMEEINEKMPLEFSVKPDTLIRVLMEFKGLEEYIEIPEQKLETPERKGFVVVEWGGTEIR